MERKIKSRVRKSHLRVRVIVVRRMIRKRRQLKMARAILKINKKLKN